MEDLDPAQVRLAIASGLIAGLADAAVDSAEDIAKATCVIADAVITGKAPQKARPDASLPGALVAAIRENPAALSTP